MSYLKESFTLWKRTLLWNCRMAKVSYAKCQLPFIYKVQKGKHYLPCFLKAAIN